MIETTGHILEEGKKCGFTVVEAFGVKTEQQGYEYFPGHKNQVHGVSRHRVTARAFWEVGEPVGFSLSKPGPEEIKNAFSTVYAVNLPAQTENYAGMLPTSARPVQVSIYDETVDTTDAHRFEELVDQIHEIAISPPFKDLELNRIHFSNALKKVYVANSNGFNAKYIKSHFDLVLGVGLRGNHLDISDSRTFLNQIDPARLITRAYNLLNSLTESPLPAGPKRVPLVLSPEASAFILKEFSHYFMVKADRKYRELSFPAILNVVDDPWMDGKAGSVPFDDEGVQAGETFLMRKGNLAGVVNDIRGAFGTGARSTGNGFRKETAVFPSVRFTNLYIKPTILSMKNLMSDAGDGVLVSLLKLKYVDKDGYLFSAYGYRFSGHHLLEPVHFYFRTGFLSYFLNILKVSKETKFFYSTANIGSPYLLLEANRKSPHLLSI